MMIDNGYENHMVLPDYSDSLPGSGEFDYEESPCPCIFCGNPCGETCEELGPLTKEESE